MPINFRRHYSKSPVSQFSLALDRGLLPVLLVSLLVLPACNSTNKSSKSTAKSNKAEINIETKFSSKEYGVKGSPRITTAKSVRKGGGRYQIGKPYKIRGKWYKPTLDPNYRKVGMASWYGPNFHGRLTANGEIYDQYSLSAAHPTMPLPSYAKVTNLENGSSVTVRVNDRGPYAHGRVIDLSAKAAKLLGYDRKGVAKVKVIYLGKARMDGWTSGFYLHRINRARGQKAITPGGSFPGTLFARAKRLIHWRPPALPMPQFLRRDQILWINIGGCRCLRPILSQLQPPIRKKGLRVPQIRRSLAFVPEQSSQSASEFNTLFDNLLIQTDLNSGTAVEFYLTTTSDTSRIEMIQKNFGRFGRLRVDSEQINGDMVHSISIYAAAEKRDGIIQAVSAWGMPDAFEIRD